MTNLLKLFTFIFILLITSCASTKIQQIDNDLYSIVREDHAGIFGNMDSFRAEVAQEVKEFAKSKNKELIKVSYKEKPVGMTPGSWARIEYTFRLVDKFNLVISDSTLAAIDFSAISSLKERFFSKNDLDVIEGLWSWSGGDYQVAIIKNDYTVFDGYEFLGIVTMTSKSSWSSGEIKLLLNSTASPSIYTGSYISGSKIKQGVAFILKDENLLTLSLPAIGTKPKLDILIIRNFPKSTGYITANRKQTSQGSCFFISPDGLIATNHHVVDGSEKFEIVDNEGKEFKAKLERLDPSNDLAVLKVEASNHNFINLSESSVKTGQEVFAIGYPASNILGSNVKFTNGVVSSTTGLNNMANMFQMTVPIQPGSSGGPVLNMQGEVVGISTSTAAVESFFKSTGSLPQNVNWAIKSAYLSLLSGVKGKQSNLSERQEVIDAAIASSCMIKATK